MKWADEPKTPRDQAIRLWYDKITDFEKAKGGPGTNEEIRRLGAQAFAELGLPPFPAFAERPEIKPEGSGESDGFR